MKLQIEINDKRDISHVGRLINNLMYDFNGNIKKCRDYCLQIAQMRGPLSQDYQDASEYFSKILYLRQVALLPNAQNHIVEGDLGSVPL